MHTSPTASLGKSANGGMNVYIAEVCRALSERGVATDIFTRRQSPEDPDQERLAPLSRVVYLPAGPPGLDKYSLAAAAGAFASAVDRFARADGAEYDLLYSHYWLSGASACWLQGPLGIPWAHTAHTLGLVKNRRLAAGAVPEPEARIRIEREIAACADLMIVSTEAEGADLAGLYDADPDRIHVVAPGVDLRTFQPRDPARARKKIGYSAGRLLLFVGRLERLKGVDVAMRAFAANAHAHPDVRLLVLGEDSRAEADGEKARLRRLALELGIAGRVDFLGSVGHDLLPDYYAAAEACLMPSFSESFGLVGLEAQACGCTVIASDVAGLASVVRDGVTGYLVDVGDLAGWAERVGRILDEPGLAEQMGRRGRLLAQRFPWSRTADRLLESFERMWARGPAIDQERLQLSARHE